MSDDEISANNATEDVKDASRNNEGEERPVREKLKNAAISSQRGTQSPDESDADAEAQNKLTTSKTKTNGRDRSLRKRSLEDLKEPDSSIGNLDAPATPSSGTHLRKRTREEKESQQADDSDRETPPGSDTPDAAAMSKSGSEKAHVEGSPRKKRSAEDMGEGGSHKQKIAATEDAQIARKSLDEQRPVLKAPGDASQSNGLSLEGGSGDTGTSKAPANGGFSNCSTASPFGTFGSKTGQLQGSGGFGAFGGGERTSAFSGATGGSAFGASTAAQSTGASTAPKLSFANAASPFTAGGGFGGAGKLNSFASSKGDFAAPPLAAKLSSFASASGGNFTPSAGKSNIFASSGSSSFGAPAKSERPFGAPEEKKTEGSGSEDEGDGDNESKADGDDTESRAEEESEKIHGPKIPPGEEDEETLWTSRAKIHILLDGVWKERGTGTFKFNIHKDSDLFPQEGEVEVYDTSADGQAEETPDSKDDLEAAQIKKTAEDDTGVEKGKTPPRFIMRAMQTQRLVLNATVFKEMKFGDPRDITKPPVGKHIMFAVQEDGKLSNYLLKVGREEELLTLYKQVKLVQRML